MTPWSYITPKKPCGTERACASGAARSSAARAAMTAMDSFTSGLVVEDEWAARNRTVLPRRSINWTAHGVHNPASYGRLRGCGGRRPCQREISQATHGIENQAPPPVAYNAFQ